MQLDAQLNPGCPIEFCENNNDPNIITVVHISSNGQHDTLHYVWDFTGKPSVLIALTSPNTNLTINWQNFMDDKPDSIEFSTKPIYTSTVVMNRVSKLKKRTKKLTMKIKDKRKIMIPFSASWVWLVSHLFS